MVTKRTALSWLSGPILGMSATITVWKLAAMQMKSAAPIGLAHQSRKCAMATPGAARGISTSRPWVRSTRGSPSAPPLSARKASSSLAFAQAPSGVR